MTVDCMTCLANETMADSWPRVISGPRWLGFIDEHGIRHAFVQGAEVLGRGW